MQVPRVVCEHFHGSPRFKREGIIFGTEGFSHFRVNRSGHGRHKKSERIELTTMLFFFNAPSLIPDGSHSHHFPLGSDKEKFWVPPVLYACLGYTKDFSLSLILVVPDVYLPYLLLFFPQNTFLPHFVLFASQGNAHWG